MRVKLTLVGQTVAQALREQMPPVLRFTFVRFKCHFFVSPLDPVSLTLGK